jgi:hypothetical protein
MKGTPKKSRQSWGAGRAAFLAHATAICAEIDQGWPMTTVYQKFKDRVGIGYRQFNRHVKAHQIKKEAAAPRRHGATAPSEPRQAPVWESPGGGHGQRQFKYDPTVNKDELI